MLLVAEILASQPDGVTAAEIANSSGLRAVIVGRVLTAMEHAIAARRLPSYDSIEMWVRGDGDPTTVNLADVPTHTVCPTGGHRTRVRPASAIRRSVAAEPGINSDGQPKLRKGELRAMVAEFITAHPGHEFTAGDIGRQLRRSPGAVQDCLGQLLADGTITYTGTDVRKVAAIAAERPQAMA